MTFSEQLQSDMSAVFINTDEFAETLIYKGYGEENVTISGVVVRGEYIKQQESYENYLLKSAVIVVQASDLLAEPNPDGDKVYLDSDLDVAWDVDNYRPIGAGIGYRIAISRRELLSAEA